MADESNEEEAVGGIEDLDFNVKDEYKADPLIPNGTYHATANAVKYVPGMFKIVWDFCLHDNGGVMNDGQTPIDGAYVQFNNWLPKPGDEAIMTKSNKTNKRQSKINILADFQEKMGIDMSTPAIIAEALANGTWIGVEADVEVTTDEYNGKFRNMVNRAKKSTMF